MAALTGRSDLPGQVPRVRQPSPRKVIAEPGEVLKLLATAKPWLRCAILFAAHTALRRSDILRAAPIHYNAEARTLTIDQKKTGSTVTIPVTETLAVSLENAPPDTSNGTRKSSICFRSSGRTGFSLSGFDIVRVERQAG